jgi:hypothetical protein
MLIVWQETERAFIADLEREKERLGMLALRHTPHRTALYRTRKRLSEDI